MTLEEELAVDRLVTVGAWSFLHQSPADDHR